jgi:hypothetical protein
MQQPSLLQSMLSSYLDGEIPLNELRGRFYSKEMTSSLTEELSLYTMVSAHLAYYTVGSWPEIELKSAIRWWLDRENGVAVAPPVPMADQQWIEIMNSGIVPWPAKQKVNQIPAPDGVTELYAQRRPSDTYRRRARQRRERLCHALSIASRV